ncbi:MULTISPECIES: galactokinase [Flavobacteriaceae]|uniref:Galactokinase n=2 Tax=Flavobacteriaceae TaxID=49546 RepID=A0A4Y8ATI7_9FLAO|nr:MULTISPECIES: galactokinase [Flavobacteriaceae]TEW75211.1 galactokinase [Gramella jeungdoensis]GGK40584.1 galactokinase [Lutibacter litoralis]
MDLNEQHYNLTINSPGRINLIGEHTDYNNGFVLPTAIDKKIQFKFKKNGTPTTCNVYSKNFDTSVTFDLNTIKPSKHQWENYILGVIFEIQQLTDKLEGFDCIFTSDIPVGSGISSSAALECGFAFGLNELFNLGLSKITLVEIGQRAEHNYVGTKCGIMDQFASVMSKVGHVILLDCQSLEYQHVPIHIKPYKILLLNTNVSHNLADGEYNKRRSLCEQGVAIIQKNYPNVTSLRDVSLEMLAEFKETFTEDMFNKCTYVVEEKTRVLDSVEALKNKNLAILGANMYATHNGLSNLYEVSCPELDFLVAFSKNFDAVIGARMMGGGFGGCTINIIHQDEVAAFTEAASQAYFNKFNIKLTAFEANPSEGTAIEN